MTKEAKEHIGFQYLLTKILLFTLILSELNIFLKKYFAKSKINQLLTIHLQSKIMILLYVDFFVLLYRIYMKLCQIIPVYFPLKNVKAMRRYSTNPLKTNMRSLHFKLKKIDETRNQLLDEIKHIDLINEKHKNTFRNLNCLNHYIFFYFCSRWLCFNCYICFISWNFCRYCKFCSRNKNLLQSLQESKSINQLSIKRRKSVIKQCFLEKLSQILFNLYNL